MLFSHFHIVKIQIIFIIYIKKQYVIFHSINFLIANNLLVYAAILNMLLLGTNRLRTLMWIMCYCIIFKEIDVQV